MNRFLWNGRTGLLVAAMMVVTVTAAGCSRQVQATAPGSDAAGPSEPPVAEWHIFHVASGDVVSFEILMDRVAGAHVVYLGEEHHNRHHIRAASRVLEGLVARGRRPVLAIEMFGWDGQDALTRYVSDGSPDRERFLRESKWKENWGGDFAEYEPLVEVARQLRLPVLAMNPPRPLVREVARSGLSPAMEDPRMARWGMREEPLVDDPAYRNVIMRQLRECHGGMSDAAYERLYEASMFRDEGMAKAVASRLRELPEEAGPVVSYTGGGHIQFRSPVPDRVARRTAKPIRQVTIYMMALEPDQPKYFHEALEERIADYIWLTPIGDHGSPARCGR